MAGVEQGVTGEDERSANGAAPTALRIDTDVFAALSETGDGGDGRAPTIVGWFDCWRH